MAVASMRAFFHGVRWTAVIDWLAVIVAASLPWSTSVSAIFIALWILAMLPTLDAEALRVARSTAAAILPIMLWLLAVIGMLWADASFVERLEGLGHFHRLLVIPLLLVHFRRSERGLYPVYAFLAASLALLLTSWALAFLPGLTWRGKEVGVPTKDYIFQSADFVLCAFALFGYAAISTPARRWWPAMTAIAVGLLFLADIFFVATSRTALLVMPVLLLWLGFLQFRWKGVVCAILVTAVIAPSVWVASPYLRDRLVTSVHELDAYQARNEANSTGLHLEFLRKSMNFVRTAPIIGHGTGSIVAQFHLSETGHDSASSVYADNPHNQILAVAIQLGLVGAALLIAMWLAHLLLFACGSGLVAWIGTIVVVQNVVSSLFNSHLFDFTSGWEYVFGVGVAGGMMLRQRDKLLPSIMSPPRVS
jgi:O-antigen ligase